MIHTPEGYTEDEVLAAIERAVNSLVSAFSFGYFDEDDMRQEGFLFACKKLPLFRPDNKRGCGLENFIRICVRREFINLRRNKLHRHAPPCSNCALSDPESDSGCSQYTEVGDCTKWSGWFTRNQAKRSLIESCDTSNLTHTMPMDHEDVCASLSCAELLQYVSDRIPLAQRADYRRFLEGAALNKTKRENVVETIRTIVREIVNEEDFEAWSSE